MLTVERLKELLHYEPLTGIFTWRVRRGFRATVGTVAGYIDDDGYVCITIECRRYRAHRLAWFYMTGDWPDPECDHEDTNKINNRWLNLRQATGSQNQANVATWGHNTSGHKGVSWHKKNKQWSVNIKKNGKQAYIASFADRVDGAICYNYHAAHLSAEFSRINVIPEGAYAHD